MSINVSQSQNKYICEHCEYKATRVSPKDFEHFLSKNPIGRNDSLFRKCNDFLLPYQEVHRHFTSYG